MAGQANREVQIEELLKKLGEAKDEDERAQYLKYIEQVQQMQIKEMESPGAVGVGSGLTRVAQDVGGILPLIQSLTEGSLDTFGKYRQGVDQERSLMDPVKAEHPISRAGETVGEIAATLPIGGVTGATPKQMPNFFGRLATNTGLGATQGALGSDDPVEGSLWGGGGSAFGSVIGEMMNLFRGGKVPNKPPSMENVPIMRADDTSSVYGSAERGAQFNPSGRSDVVDARTQQQEAFQEGVGVLQDKYNKGNDVNQLPVSLTDVMQQRKTTAGKKYDVVGEQMEGAPVDESWIHNIDATIRKLEADPPNLRDNALISKLRAYKDYSDPEYLAPGGRAPTWDELRRLRSIISKDISDSFKGGSRVGTTDTGALYEAKNAVTGSLDDAAEGNTGSLWRDADQNYRTNVMEPYKDSPSIVKDIMNVQSPEEIVDKLLTKNVSNNSTKINLVMSALDEPGKSALRTEILNRAFAPEQSGIISPAKAANFIHSKRELFVQMFPGEDIDELVKFLRYIKGAGQYGDLPATGMGAQIASGVVPMGVGGAAGYGGLAAGADLVTTGGLVATGMAAPTIIGKILAAAATGEPGAIGNVIAAIGQHGAEPLGRLAGQIAPTDD